MVSLHERSFFYRNMYFSAIIAFLLCLMVAVVLKNFVFCPLQWPTLFCLFVSNIPFVVPGPKVGLDFWTISTTGGPDPASQILAVESCESGEGYRQVLHARHQTSSNYGRTHTNVTSSLQNPCHKGWVIVSQQKGHCTRQASDFQPWSPSSKCFDAQMGDHLDKQFSRRGRNQGLRRDLQLSPRVSAP
jgi:hypothetical protein